MSIDPVGWALSAWQLAVADHKSLGYTKHGNIYLPTRVEREIIAHKREEERVKREEEMRAYYDKLKDEQEFNQFLRIIQLCLNADRPEIEEPGHGPRYYSATWDRDLRYVTKIMMFDEQNRRYVIPASEGLAMKCDPELEQLRIEKFCQGRSPEGREEMWQMVFSHPRNYWKANWTVFLDFLSDGHWGEKYQRWANTYLREMSIDYQWRVEVEIKT